MLATPGNMTHFATHEHKAARFCIRLSMRKIAAFLRMQHNATAHMKVAASVEEYIEERINNGQRN